MSINNWQEISGPWNGPVAQISVGSATEVWVVKADGQIYRKMGNNGQWNLFPGQLANVSVAKDDTVWGVNASGLIYHLNGNNWQQISGPWNGPVAQISVGSATEVWAVQADGRIYRKKGNDGSPWRPVDGSLTNVSVASDGTVWGVNASGFIYRYDGNGWQQTGGPNNGPLAKISVRSANEVWAVKADGTVFRKKGNDQSFWVEIPGPGPLSNLSVADDGTVWGTNSAGTIFRFPHSTPLAVANPRLVEITISNFTFLPAEVSLADPAPVKILAPGEFYTQLARTGSTITLATTGLKNPQTFTVSAYTKQLYWDNYHIVSSATGQSWQSFNVTFNNRCQFSVDLFVVDDKGRIQATPSLVLGRDGTAMTRCPEGTIYRAYAKDTGQEVFLYVAKADDTQVCNIQPKSWNGNQLINVTFVNSLDQAIVLNWVDYQGKENTPETTDPKEPKYYEVLQPGQTKRQRSCATHPFVIRSNDAQKTVLSFVIACQPDQVVRIAKRLPHEADPFTTQAPPPSIPLAASPAPAGMSFHWQLMRHVPSMVPPVGFKSISVADAFDIWALDETGNVHIWGNANEWLPLKQLAHISFGQITTAGDGTRIALDDSGNMWKCSGSDYDWTRIYDKSTANNAEEIEWITAGGDSAIYATGKRHTSFKWTSGKWQDLNKKLKFISAGTDGDLWGLEFYQHSGELHTRNWYYNQSTGQWVEYQQVTNLLMSIHVGDSDHIAAMDRRGTVILIPGYRPEITPITLSNAGLQSLSIQSLSIGADGTVVAIINRQPYMLLCASAGKFSPQFLFLGTILKVFVVMMVLVVVTSIVDSAIRVKVTEPPALPPPRRNPKLDFAVFPNIFSFGYFRPTKPGKPTKESENLWRFDTQDLPQHTEDEANDYTKYPTYRITDATKRLVAAAFDQYYNSIINIYNIQLWNVCAEYGIKYIVDLHRLVEKMTTVPASYEDLPPGIRAIVEGVEANAERAPYCGYAIYHELNGKTTNEKRRRDIVANVIKMLGKRYSSARFYIAVRGEGGDASYVLKQTTAGATDAIGPNRYIIALQEFHSVGMPEFARKFGELPGLQGARRAQMMLYDHTDPEQLQKVLEGTSDYEAVFDYLLNSHLVAGLLGSSMLAAQLFFDAKYFTNPQGRKIKWTEYDAATEIQWNLTKVKGLTDAFKKLAEKKDVIDGLARYNVVHVWSTPMEKKAYKDEGRKDPATPPSGFAKEPLGSTLSVKNLANVYVGEFANENGTIYIIANHYTWKGQDVELKIHNGKEQPCRLEKATADNKYEWEAVKKEDVPSGEFCFVSFTLKHHDIAFVRLTKVIS